MNFYSGKKFDTFPAYGLTNCTGKKGTPWETGEKTAKTGVIPTRKTHVHATLNGLKRLK
jgi:hypothetical protein